MNRPMLGSKRHVLSLPFLELGHSRLQLVDGRILALRLIRQFPEELQDLADEVLRALVGVQWPMSVAEDRG